MNSLCWESEACTQGRGKRWGVAPDCRKCTPAEAAWSYQAKILYSYVAEKINALSEEKADLSDPVSATVCKKVLPKCAWCAVERGITSLNVSDESDLLIDATPRSKAGTRQYGETGRVQLACEYTCRRSDGRYDGDIPQRDKCQERQQCGRHREIPGRNRIRNTDFTGEGCTSHDQNCQDGLRTEGQTLRLFPY